MKSNNGHLASYWKPGNSAQGRLTLSHMTQGASQWPWKRAQWDPGCLQLPWNMVKQWFRRGGGFFPPPEGVGWEAPAWSQWKPLPDTPPWRAAKIISASWGIHKHERRAPECSMLHKLSAPLSSSSPSSSSSLLQFLFPSLLCLGWGAGGDKAQELAWPFYPKSLPSTWLTLLFVSKFVSVPQVQILTSASYLLF